MARVIEVALAGRGSICALPKLTPSQVAALWAARAPMFLGADALPYLDDWAARVTNAPPGTDHKGPGRSPTEQLSLVAYLRGQALKGEPITFNALWREDHGGREYPFVMPGYAGPVNISRRAYRAADGPGGRLLLSAIRKDVRRLLRLPVGFTLLDADFKSCHGHIALALTGDQQLARDLAQDFHQITGDWMLDHGAFPDEKRRRYLGKAVNNAMLFGLSPYGLPRVFQVVLGAHPDAAMSQAFWARWWDRYPMLKDLRDDVQQAVYAAQCWTGQLWVTAPSGRISKFTVDEVLGNPTAWNPKRREPGDVWRSVFSAVFRAIESELLQRTLAYFAAGSAVHGGRPVLPLYDGMLAAAPIGNVRAVTAALEAAGAQAGRDLGVPALRLTVTTR